MTRAPASDRLYALAGRFVVRGLPLGLLANAAVGFAYLLGNWGFPPSALRPELLHLGPLAIAAASGGCIAGALLLGLYAFVLPSMPFVVFATALAAAPWRRFGVRSVALCILMWLAIGYALGSYGANVLHSVLSL